MTEEMTEEIGVRDVVRAFFYGGVVGVCYTSVNLRCCRNGDQPDQPKRRGAGSTELGHGIKLAKVFDAMATYGLCHRPLPDLEWYLISSRYQLARRGGRKAC
jgi:hypothetical protein